MAKYRALRRGQIFADGITPARRGDVPDNRRVVRVVEPGEVFDFNGKPGSWMERVDKSEKGEAEKEASGPGGKKVSTSTGQSDGQGASAKP